MITNCIALRKNPAFREFRNYVLSFYGYDGIYPIEGLTVADVEVGIVEYIKMCTAGHFEWGDGDSLDRERVRVILESEGFSEAAHLPAAKELLAAADVVENV